MEFYKSTLDQDELTNLRTYFHLNCSVHILYQNHSCYGQPQMQKLSVNKDSWKKCEIFYSGDWPYCKIFHLIFKAIFSFVSHLSLFWQVDISYRTTKIKPEKKLFNKKNHTIHHSWIKQPKLNLKKIFNKKTHIKYTIHR